MFKWAVVIPTYNRKNFLLHLLEQLSTLLPPNFAILIIVVVDGSTDGTLEALNSGYPQVKVIEGNGHWWWTRSVNQGCQYAVQNGAQAVLLLNDDISLDDAFFHHLLAAAQRQPQAMIGALNLTNEKEKRIFFSGAPAFHWWSGQLLRYHTFLSPIKPPLSGLHPSVVLPGRALWIPIEAFNKIGYFDELALPQYKADYDFVLKAHKHHFQTLISWDSILFVNMNTTGDGATFAKKKSRGFFSSLFKKHSRTSLQDNLVYYFRHYPRWALPLLPLTSLLILFRQLFALFFSRKY